MAAQAANVVPIGGKPRQAADPEARAEARRARTRQGKVARQISDVPYHQIACRIRHRWPMDEDLVPGLPMPQGVEVIRHNEGPNMLREECKRCGKKRWQDLLPGDIYDVNAPYGYIDPTRDHAKGEWVTIDPESHITPRDLRAFAFSRVIR